MRYVSLLLALLLCGCSSTDRSPPSGPVVWEIKSGDSHVFILGFGEARDRSWWSPTIERALKESDDVWFETPQGNVPGASALTVLRLGYDKSKPLATVLDPALFERTVAMADSLGVDIEKLKTMRPWMARNTIQRAWQASGKAGVVEADYADRVIAERALAASKPLRFEYATFEAVLGMFAGMSDKAQSEYLRDMLDYIDDAAKGLHARHEEWIIGKPNTDSIDKQRRDTPALYDAMHVQRNKWWADRIEEMLQSRRTHFVVVGLNHVLGPDSIIQNLKIRNVRIDVVRAKT